MRHETPTARTPRMGASTMTALRFCQFVRLTLLGLAGAASFAPAVARAEVVTYSVSGVVSTITDTSSDDYVPTNVQDNVSPFVGTFSFDNAAPGSGGIYEG